MRGLAIIVVEAAPERLRAALALACAQAALGGGARLFLQGEAVALLDPPIRAAADERHRAAGLPDLAALWGEAVALGVRIGACQSGLALTGLAAEALDPAIEWGGLVGLLADLGEDRLVGL